MLSAVENFGPATAAAPPPHVYAHHHNPFAIAAAAAAASSAAAAAAAVMPIQSQTSLEHYTIAHSSLLANNQQALNNSGIYLSPQSHLSAIPPPQSSSRVALSPQLNSDSVTSSVVTAMSSTEFARPHPKQPRYNNSNNNNNNNSISSNNNISSNGIPIHLRGTKIGSNCLSTAPPSSRSKYSAEQAGPVNLATNNNNCSSSNNNSDSLHNNNNSVSSSPNLEGLNGVSAGSQQQSSESDVMAGIYAQKLPFTAPAVVTNAAAVAAAAYQFNYPHLYGRAIGYGTSALYPSHPLSSRSQLHSRPTYIAQHEPFSPYLPPSVSYSSPSVPAPPPGLLRPPPPTQPPLSLGNPHSATNLLNNSHSSSNISMCGGQMPIMSDRPLQQMHHVPPASLIATEHRSLPSPRNKESPKSSYVNGEVNTSVAGSVSGFKVPCGKEGSLKHRILTRPPYGERDSRRRSPITATIMRSPGNNSAPSNFSKGAFIELSNGVLRKVEDMRTDDFIQSADKSPYHQLADSTVVKIENTPNSVIITFSYDKNRSKADVEVSQEHPFFVYGQGWASCNPELSLQAFGLKCQRLQVGDVCLSLKAREQHQSQPTPSSVPPHPSPQSTCSYSAAQLYKEDISPQNLSRRPHSSVTSSTIPTTATGTAVTSRLTGPQIPPHLVTSQAVPHPAMLQPYDVHMFQGNSQLPRHHSSPPSAGIPHHLLSHCIGKPLPLADSRFLPDKRAVELQSSPPLSSSAPTTRPPSNQPFYLGPPDIGRSSNGGSTTSGSHDGDMHHLTPEQQAAVEASLSRKRRWSAPDNICDDEGCPPAAAKTKSNS